MQGGGKSGEKRGWAEGEERGTVEKGKGKWKKAWKGEGGRVKGEGGRVGEGKGNRETLRQEEPFPSSLRFSLPQVHPFYTRNAG